MSRFIYEDDIEKALLDKLAAEPFGYDVITCDPSTSSKENMRKMIEKLVNNTF